MATITAALVKDLREKTGGSRWIKIFMISALILGTIDENNLPPS